MLLDFREKSLRLGLFWRRPTPEPPRRLPLSLRALSGLLQAGKGEVRRRIDTVGEPRRTPPRKGENGILSYVSKPGARPCAWKSKSPSRSLRKPSVLPALPSQKARR